MASMQEYLSSNYRPDREFIDGVLLERSLGEYDHARLHTEIAFYFRSRFAQWGLRAMVDQRVQVGANRYRVPDICVIARDPREQVLRTPPLMCIEILSKNDSLIEMRERVADYLTFGVPYVWVINPAARKAWRCATAGVTEVAELRTQAPDTVIPLAELFENQL